MIDRAKLEKELSRLPEGWVVLIETSAEKSFETGIASIKILTKKNYLGIIVSASRPYMNLMSIYQKNGISIDNIFIIDCISKSQNADVETKNVLYTENVSALTNISLLISECIKRKSGKKFIFIDSITTMLIHNKPNVFARFIHSVLTRMRLNGISGLLISLERETDAEVRAEIAQLCDKVIKI